MPHTKQQRILIAADDGDMETLRSLVQTQEDANALAFWTTDPKTDEPMEFRPLHRASTIEICQFLIKKGADVQATAWRDTTALHIAAEEGRLDVVRYLVEEHNSDIEAETDYETCSPLQGTPLTFAVVENQMPVVKYLIKQGANANEALWKAARDGNLEACTVLVQAGANLDFSYGNGNLTPLQVAIWQREDERLPGHLFIIRLLIKNGADINVHRPGDGDTALMMAVQFGYYDAVHALLQAGADVNAKDNDGYNALHLVLSDQGFYELTERYDMGSILLNYGIDKTAVTSQGKTALELAADMKWDYDYGYGGDFFEDIKELLQ